MTTTHEEKGIYKMLNGAMEKLNCEQFIIVESWRKQKARLQADYPTAKIKYSYKTKQFRIIFDLPSDLKEITGIEFFPEPMNK